MPFCGTVSRINYSRSEKSGIVLIISRTKHDMLLMQNSNSTNEPLYNKRMLWLSWPGNSALYNPRCMIGGWTNSQVDWNVIKAVSIIITIAGLLCSVWLVLTSVVFIQTHLPHTATHAVNTSSLCTLAYHSVSMVLVHATCPVTLVSDLRPRPRLCSAPTAALVVPATHTPHLATDRAFLVIAARLWNSLPDNITAATFLLTVPHKLKTFVFRRSMSTLDLPDKLLFIIFFWFLILSF